MENLERLLGKNEFLTLVQSYVLNRENVRMRIDVNEVLTGQDKGKFIAIPNTIIRDAQIDYIGKGDSINDALEDCLKRVKDVSLDQLFPKQPGV